MLDFSATNAILKLLMLAQYISQHDVLAAFVWLQADGKQRSVLPPEGALRAATKGSSQALLVSGSFVLGYSQDEPKELIRLTQERPRARQFALPRLYRSEFSDDFLQFAMLSAEPCVCPLENVSCSLCLAR